MFWEQDLMKKVTTYIFVTIIIATSIPYGLMILWFEQMTINQGLALLSLLLITWLAGFYLARKIAEIVASPIRTLNTAVERFSEGDLGYQVPLQRDEETNRLLTSFNNLSVALEESLGYLNQYAADLQMELEEKEELMAEQQKMYLNLVNSSAKAIEVKDLYTRGHSDRVANLTEKVAQKMNLPEKTVQNARIAAALHDIGKIGLQDAILQKPSTLTKEEFDVVKQHPVNGAEIILPLQLGDEVVDGVKYHHEKYNGKGYPEGKKGSEIGIVPKIISIADAFDAMTSSRSYRKALSIEIALMEIRRCSGSQFDPQVVEAFYEVILEENPYLQEQVETTSAH